MESSVLNITIATKTDGKHVGSIDLVAPDKLGKLGGTKRRIRYAEQKEIVENKFLSFQEKDERRENQKLERAKKRKRYSLPAYVIDYED